VERNCARSNAIGFQLDVKGNGVIHNSAGDNGSVFSDDYVFKPGEGVGIIRTSNDITTATEVNNNYRY